MRYSMAGACVWYLRLAPVISAPGPHRENNQPEAGVPPADLIAQAMNLFVFLSPSKERLPNSNIAGKGF
jgi:hypothetical protein